MTPQPDGKRWRFTRRCDVTKKTARGPLPTKTRGPPGPLVAMHTPRAYSTGLSPLCAGSPGVRRGGVRNPPDDRRRRTRGDVCRDHVGGSLRPIDPSICTPSLPHVPAVPGYCNSGANFARIGRFDAVSCDFELSVRITDHHDIALGPKTRARRASLWVNPHIGASMAAPGRARDGRLYSKAAGFPANVCCAGLR